MYVYRQYQSRWRFEEAHRDLKQQFGLLKCQTYQIWVFAAFASLVSCGYTLWKFTLWSSSQDISPPLKCPSWAETFYHNLVYIDLEASS
ncbi:MAG: hypothetical protein ACTSPV_15205 [Candidatus Hodarchaeales archaeon]